MTGDFILNIVDAVPMTLTESEDGSLIGYFVNQTSRTLNMWNSTHAIQYPTSNATVNWMWRPALNSRINFSRGIMWTVPLATTIGGNTISPNLGISKVGSDVILMTSHGTKTVGTKRSSSQRMELLRRPDSISLR